MVETIIPMFASRKLKCPIWGNLGTIGQVAIRVALTEPVDAVDVTATALVRLREGSLALAAHPEVGAAPEGESVHLVANHMAGCAKAAILCKISRSPQTITFFCY